MACGECGGARKHADGCSAGGSSKPARGTCSECGEKSGDPHKNTCSRAQKRRRQGGQPQVPRPNTGAPRSETYGKVCPPHNPSPYKKGPRGSGTMWYRCAKCQRHLGKW